MILKIDGSYVEVKKYEHKKEVITQKGVRREKYLTHGGYQVIWFENGDVQLLKPAL